MGGRGNIRCGGFLQRKIRKLCRNEENDIEKIRRFGSSIKIH
jgi:hypothetical protein